MGRTGFDVLHRMLLATSCLVAAPFIAASSALAGGPSGATVVVGQATVTAPNSTNTVVTQTSNKALIDWNSFSISAGSTVTFDQPGSKSITVNRVTGDGTSAIYGDLLANGRIWIINANGILFGKGSEINVGALIATTSDISDEDFRKGHYSFGQASTNAAASVVNQGTIEAHDHGSVVLSGASVSNQGVIQANLGTVVLGGADAFTVDLKGDNLIRYQVTAPVSKTPTAADGSPAAALVSNSGTIQANGGKVLMTARAAHSVEDSVINNSGIVEATSISSHDGEIDLDAGPDGTVNAGGTLDVSGKGAGQTGGTVAITGATVNVVDGARIDASGDAGGGSVSIGGDFHGKGKLADATQTNIGNATIDADAITKGNGGQVAVWSNTNTTFSGTISAKGGAQGGNGGYVETSGGNLQVGLSGFVDTSAVAGKSGTWLLDPENIVIATGGTTSLSGGTDGLGNDPDGTDTIAPSTITNALQAGTDVTLEASNNITVSNDVIYSSSNDLSLLAEGGIYVYANIQNTQASGGGAINLIAGWDGTTLPPASLTAPGAYGAQSEESQGVILIGGENAAGNVAVGSASGLVTVAGSNVVLDAENGFAQIGFHGTGGGGIVIDTTQDLDVVSGSAAADYAQIGNGDASGTNAGIGNVTGDIDVQVAGDTEFYNEGGPAWLGNVAGTGAIETGNVTLVTDTGFVPADFVVADLGSTAGTGGDVTLGFTTTEEVFLGGVTYSSANDFAFLGEGDMEVDGSVTNTGSGAITLVAGWDGHTLGSAAQLRSAGAYGQNDAVMTIGGEDADGDVDVGSLGGTTTVLSGDLIVEADNGFAQLGSHATGGGDIVVDLMGDLTLTGNSETSADYAQIGNGDASGDNATIGSVTGNISLNLDGTIDFNGYSDDGGGIAWLGNVAGTQGTNPIESGNLTLIAGNEDDNGDADLGEMIGAALGTTGSAGSGGSVTIGFTDPEDGTMVIDHAGTVDSPNTLTILSTGNIALESTLQNQGSGAVTLISGWNTGVVSTGDVINTANAGDSLVSLFTGAAGSYGLDGGSILIGGEGAESDTNVGSNGGTTTVLADNLTIEADNGFAQLGYHGSGGGDITVDLNGDLALTGNSENPADYAQIGNGDAAGSNDAIGSVTGNIALDVAGSFTFDGFSDDGGGLAWLGNVAGTQGASPIESGNVVLIAGKVYNSSDINFGAIIEADLGSTSSAGSGGNVTIGLTDPGENATEIGPQATDTPNTLTIVSAGDLAVTGSMQNQGTGAINLIAGWNTETVTPQQVIAETNAPDGSFATLFNQPNSSGGTITIGGEDADGNVSVGSASGTTTVFAQYLTVESDNGVAQLGYAGAGGGDIDVFDGSTVTVDAQAGGYAQIGNGGANVGGNVGGDIDVSSGGNIVVEADNGIAAIGNLGGATSSQSGSLIVDASDELGITAAGTDSNAFIGNASAVDSSGGATGDINVSAGSTIIDAEGDGSQAFIGDGLRFKSSGPSGGNIQVDTGSLMLTADESDGEISEARIANRGDGDVSGDIGIDATGDIELLATDSNLAAIGNGEAGSGTTSGTIMVQSGANISILAQDSGEARIAAGAATDTDINVTAVGDITLSVTGTPDEGDSGPIGGQAIIGNFGGDTIGGNILVTSSGGTIDLAADEANSYVQIGSNGTTSASGTVTVSASNSEGVVELSSDGEGANVQIGNGTPSGTAGAAGAVSVSAGDAVVVTQDATDSVIQIGNGGTDATGDFSGDVTVTATRGDVDLTVEGAGSYIQIGNGGDGVVGDTSGNVAVTASNGNILADVTINQSHLQIGNGGYQSTGNDSGDITLSAHDNVELTTSDTSDPDLSGGSYVQVGNGGPDSNQNSTTGFSETGDIAVSGANITLASSDSATSATPSGEIIGNGGDCAGCVTEEDVATAGSVAFGGNITITATNSLSMEDNGTYDGAQIGNGGDNSGSGLDITAGTLSDSGNIMVDVGTAGTAGTLTMTTGTAGNSILTIGDGGLNADSGAQASGGVSILGDVNIAVKGGADHGATATLDAATTAPSLIQVGDNGAAITNGTVTGNVVFTVDGSAALSDTPDVSLALIGDTTGVSGAATGTATIEAQSISGIAPSLQNDIAGGDVTLEVLGPGALVLASPVDYSSTHTLDVLAAGDIDIEADVENGLASGGGDINIVAGWDGSTTAAASLTNAGVFGNNGGSVNVGGSNASGNAGIGDASGTLTVAADNVALAADNGFAQLGYDGAGGGAIDVVALNDVSVAANGGSLTALIGNGGESVSGDVGGTIDVMAGGDVTVTGNGVGSWVAIGNIGGNGSAQSGGITVDATGNLVVDAAAADSKVYVGNFETDGLSGEASGDIAVTAASVTIETGGAAPEGATVARIGNGFLNSGASGTVMVSTAGALDLDAAATDSFAQIGNGAFNSDGTASGGITVNAGTVSLAAGGGNAVALIGNGVDGPQTGNVTIDAASLSGDLAPSMANDLPGGDFTVALTGDDTLTIASDADYTSGHTLSLSNGGDIEFDGSVQNAGSGAIDVTAGGNVLIGGEGAAGNVAVGGAGGTLTLAADSITIEADNGYAQLGYHGSGGGDIYASATGDITLSALRGVVADYALLGNGSLGGDVSGHVTGDIYLSTPGTLQFNTCQDCETPAAARVGNQVNSDGGSESGNLTILIGDEDDNCDSDTCGDAFGAMIEAALGSSEVDGSGGNVTLGFTDPHQDDSNAVSISDGFDYDSPNNLTILSATSIGVSGALQNAGTGDVTLVAGWNTAAVTQADIFDAVKNGASLAALFTGTANSYGQTNNDDPNHGSIQIGGSNADGNAAIGSAGGTTTVLTDDLIVEADNGFAQLGYNGAASGAITVDALGSVSLTGGGAAGQYAQIGNGGLLTSGNEGGDIAVTAAGNVTLTGGTGQEAYAQIGNGGAQANKNSEGYTNSGTITVNGQSVVLLAGGNESYAQIGNGGYDVGDGLTGTGINTGDITVDAVQSVSLTGGGIDGYAQIGNGGDKSNANAGSSAGGANSGDIVVAVSDIADGSLDLTAGSGADSYVQIGNGGFSSDAPTTATAANFTDSGSVTVSDLTLIGSDTGADGYAQIGNGDSSGNNVGDVSGDITIMSPDAIVIDNGTAPGSSAMVGGATGDGTVTGTIDGYTPPNNSQQQQQQTSTVASLTTQTPSPTGGGSNIVVSTPILGPPASDASNTGLTDNTTASPSPIQQMADSSDNGDAGYEGTEPSDTVTVSLGQSLSGGHTKPGTTVTHTIIPGMLKQVVMVGTSSPHGVPPADQDYSSWGNEALWQW